MPEELQKILKNMPDSIAESVWIYLDETPDVVIELIRFISDTHKELTDRIAFPIE